ncbi:uroporphyrin-III C-methyltransferase [Hyphomicrobium nitrativorans NL23]|uniref:uroporphyrinogen-III C-methyltransferase n=1 Tax=Hyphomicrobium nitrativorans NL23 TaxID=1029756 RepID=V5SGF0_9HYPH|nr:uroporphyrinogen-III C-methyltransferase [Hyphomicrobium nitrativorans]AHB49120.1 uroporphyrin-III C-methyltransferase [Hyphomicrobium nitrativorans NL23]
MPFSSDIFPPFPEMAPGEVWLVGAGPGDPRLLTVMAVHALRQANTIVHDALVDPRILRLAAGDAEIHFAGKRGGRPSSQQRDINELIVAEAKKGRRVLRLKGGDPFVFGRGGEEARALVQAGIPYRVVPGLTAGLAAPALAGIPATSRDTNHAVILAAGHRAAGDEGAADWEALAATGQPIVLYMALAQLPEIVAAFERGGLSADTPATIISNATGGEERILETRLSRLVSDAKVSGIEPPAVIVVGANAALRATLAPGMVRL